jgi:hypothetical protein
MKENITIIGKNSTLYKNLSLDILKKTCNLIELSYQDIDDISSIKNPIIFSYSKKIYENNIFIKKIIAKSSGKIILISSIASDVFSIAPYYNYPKIKYFSEFFIKKTDNYLIIKIGIVKNNSNSLDGFQGLIKSTLVNDIENVLNFLNLDSKTKKIIECWNFENVNNSFAFKMTLYFQKKIFKISSIIFYMFRPMLFFYKIIGYKNYGYTFIANNLK